MFATMLSRVMMKRLGCISVQLWDIKQVQKVRGLRISKVAESLLLRPLRMAAIHFVLIFEGLLTPWSRVLLEKLTASAAS